MKPRREIRLQAYGRSAIRPLVRLGDVGKWSMVKRSDSAGAEPFVIPRRDWDRLSPLRARN